MAVLFSQITYNDSASVPLGFYHISYGQPKRGDLVLFREPLKIAAAVEGDVVELAPEGCRINGKLWPHSAPLAGITNIPWGTYHIKRGWIWALGDDPRSWDSRYRGPLPASLIDGTANPLWTW